MNQKLLVIFFTGLTILSIVLVIWMGQTAVNLSKEARTLKQENVQLSLKLADKTNALYEANLELEKERNR